MVDLTNISEVTDLYNERDTLTRALDYLAGGGRIVSMVIAPGPSDSPVPQMQMPAGVNTSDMEYPPQMVAEIRSQLVERQREINEKLAAFGVTGLA